MKTMKKILFVTFFAAVTNLAFSQGNIRKGDWMVGGNVNFSSSKYADADNSYKQFQLSPNAGYFFINQLAGGLRLNLNSSRYEALATQKSTHFTIAPFVRYYFLPATQKINVFADAGYGFGEVKTTSGSSEQSYNINGFAGKAGIAIFLTPAAALEFSIGFDSDKEEFASKRYNTVSTGFGFQIHLPGKK
jgi:hypothetical protein